MGTCCVAGVNGIKVSEEDKTLTFADGTVVHEGDVISLDGSTGNVYLGEIATQEAELTGDFGRFMGWADEIRTLHVRTNGDTPRDATQARKFGAEGIGLCRTEHMFFEPARIKAVREMIISDTLEQRKAALAKILPMQRGDFEAIYRAMGGLPVTIRLLDPPLHEFLPHEDDEIKELADAIHARGGKVVGTCVVCNPWLLDKLEPYCDALTIQYTVSAVALNNALNAQVDVISGDFAPTGKLSLTMVSDPAVIAITEQEIDGVVREICASPNDVPGYDKDQYIDPAILANVKGGSYAYCDADGNYYRSGFGLNY